MGSETGSNISTEGVKIINGKNNEQEESEASPAGFSVTKKFLEVAFEKEVLSFEVRPGSNAGDNYMSLMLGVEVIFKEEEEEGAETSHNYLIKCYPNNPSQREFLDQIDVFGKELFMYQEFLPALNSLVKGSGADESSVGLSSAPFHGGNVAKAPSEKWRGSEWALENFIIFEDLRSSGFGMVDRLHSKLIMEEIGRWHGLAWALKEKNGWPLLSERYPNIIDWMYSDEKLKARFKPFKDQFFGAPLKMVEESLGEGHPAYQGYKKMMEEDPMNIMTVFVEPHGISDPEDVYEEYLRIKPEVDEEYCKEPWLILTHGDCWVNNFLFRYDPSGTRPLQVTFVDLQVAREACPTLDLGYFLSSSVRSSIRIPHKDELLLCYHDSFLRSCQQLKVKPYPGFNFNSLKRRYRRSELASFWIAMTALTLALKPKEESVDMDESSSKDGKDADAAEMFAKAAQPTNSMFKEELLSTVLDLYENGII